MNPPLLVLDVVGLTPRLLEHVPSLARLARTGWAVPVQPVFPALTCPAQATYLTGRPPGEHGIVGNGWYFRELGEVWLWRQSHALIETETLWSAARRRGLSVANICWWYAMGAGADWTVTPRPIYHADGRKTPDCYTRPPALHDALEAELGPFPLFRYWGPGAGIASSEWIARATARVLARHRPAVTFAYLPHLDYDLQRFGPDGPEAVAAATELDGVLAPLLAAAAAAGARVVAVSEYGLERATTPVEVNRMLRRAGWLEVSTQGGMEYLDPHESAAFAVADHQIAHVYVADRGLVPMVAAALAGVPGVAEVLDASGQQARGMGHPRSGELVAVAEPGAWFTYHYWTDDDRAPDFARTVEIHRKPGYDPGELFVDPADRLARARIGVNLAKKALGLRATMDVVPLDPTWVKGTHGRLPDRSDAGPMAIGSDPDVAPAGPLRATDVHDVLLRHLD